MLLYLWERKFKNINMLRRLSIIAATVACAVMPSVAQKIYPVGVSGSGSEMALVVAAKSTLVVNLEVEVEQVIVGPYARYAQELLGVRAPLVAKSSAKIISADLSLAPSDYYVATDAMLSYGGEKEISSAAGVVPIDYTSSSMLSLEEAAEEAAAAIFRTRTLCRDILSGELGEGFYGGGLGAALDRLDYEERQLAELFLGRTVRRVERVTRYVALDGDEKRYVVCRFDPSEGVAPVGDLSSEPIVLQLTPSEQDVPAEPVVDAKSRKIVYRVPNIVKCDLYSNSALIASKSMPLNEFGYDYTQIVVEK